MIINTTAPKIVTKQSIVDASRLAFSLALKAFRCSGVGPGRAMPHPITHPRLVNTDDRPEHNHADFRRCDARSHHSRPFLRS